jgi:transposase
MFHPHLNPPRNCGACGGARAGATLPLSKTSPVTTHVYELSAEERACPCRGVGRAETGADESWQIEYFPGHSERLQHVRKKYACKACDNIGDNPRITAASKSETRD